MTERPLTPYMRTLIEGVSGGDPAARDQLTEDVRRAMADVDGTEIIDTAGTTCASCGSYAFDCRESVERESARCCGQCSHVLTAGS